jgi:uncharacterized membrane protein
MESKRGQNYQGRQRTPRNGNGEGLIKGLGWFSIGLGLAGILAPKRVAKLAGVKIKKKPAYGAMIRLCGFREVASGIGILSGCGTAGWLWARVAGDLVDLGLIESAMFSKKTKRKRASIASAAVLGVTALDLYALQQVRGSSSTNGQLSKTMTIIVNRSPQEVYAFWRQPENFPRFIDNIESIQVTEGGQWHWKMKGPAGKTIEWKSEIVEDQPGSLISWRSTEESDVYNAGSVRFEHATGGRGTLITVNLEYYPPGGAIGADIAKLFGKEAGQQVEDALRRMKQVLETGNVVRSESWNPSGLHESRPPDAEGELGAQNAEG